MASLVPALQRAIAWTDRGAARGLWRLVYAGAARAFAGNAIRGERGASAYVRGTLASGEAIAGLADVDVEVVLPADADLAAARQRVRRRFERGKRALPAVGGLLFDWPAVHDERGLAEAAASTVFTYGLDRRPPRSAYHGPHADEDWKRLLERPELYGPAASWRHLIGPRRALPEAPRDPATRRLAAWLELQNWWGWAFHACLHPDRPRNAYLCVKLVAEPVRALVWMTEARRVASRLEALELGQRELPEHAAAFERAHALHRDLRRMPPAPLDDFLPALVALSARLAAEVADQVEPHGTTAVRLSDPAAGPLALPHGVWDAEARPLPLADWRALAAPVEPDETFAPVAGAPDRATIAALAAAADRGTYPTLRAGDLLVRPAAMGGRQRLRAVQCPAGDPVSFALLDGARTAAFPNVAGWSIQDTARRALAEHAGWLAHGRRADRAGTELGRLITAARAGLLWESVEAGEPRLPLTADATLELLAASARGASAAADSGRDAYRSFLMEWAAPPEGTIAALRAAVERLPAYALDERLPAAA